MSRQRRPGVSVLLAAQNEEEMLEVSAESFLELADEIIVVSNGSTDRTPEIGRRLARRHRSIRFYEAPNLRDLYENRQFGLERSRYEWIVRADSDYVCRPEVRRLRKALLASDATGPVVYSTRHVNLAGDFWHTGRRSLEHITSPLMTSYVPAPPPVSRWTPRIYRYVPGLEFARLGRWEGARVPEGALTIEWKNPTWFHCSIKSERNMFFRSERTNWRELGDFDRYPNLVDYLQEVCRDRYGTDSIDAAIERFMQEIFLPSIERYDPERWYAYPETLQEKIERDPVYRVVYEDGRPARRERVEPRGRRHESPQEFRQRWRRNLLGSRALR